jgi:DNA-binding NarL/FixJ family response regulator
MGLVLENARKKPTPTPWRGLPARMRVLYITTPKRTGGWLAEAFAADSASEVILEESVGSTAGLARLRDEAYDAVLASHVPGELDALSLIEGYRAGGADEPIVVLGMQSEQEMAALCYEVGADGYACVNTTTTRNLIWVVARAVQRHQLIRDNRRLNQAERRRLQQEHDEAEQLLKQQRGLIRDLETLRSDRSATSVEQEDAAGQPLLTDWPPEGIGRRRQRGSCQPLDLPPELVAHYRELLRAYVIMGSGNLACELTRLAELLTMAGVSARQTMQLHVEVLEELVHGLGARSTRHVMTRADLLVLEIMIHLAESYRLRYQNRTQPPVQKVLPGFDQGPPAVF